MRLEIKIGEKIYAVDGILGQPCTTLIEDKSEGQIHVVPEQSYNKFLINMHKSMFMNTECVKVVLSEYSDSNEVIREIIMNDTKIESITNNTICIECETWEDN